MSAPFLSNLIIIASLLLLICQRLHALPTFAAKTDISGTGNSKDGQLIKLGSEENNDALKIELLEYFILGAIVGLLLLLLGLLRYMFTLKEKCPSFCCAWFPTPELKQKSSQRTRSQEKIGQNII